MTKQKSDIWNLITVNANELSENFYSKLHDNVDAKLLKAINAECKHKKGTVTQTVYDTLTQFKIIRYYCVECHTLIQMSIYKTDKVTKNVC